VGETMYYSEEINKRQKIPINVSSFSSGIYIATIITNKNRYNLKFIKK
jgi:hypothetical protein